MSLRTELEESGRWLFRHRSYLPLLTLPALASGLLSFTYIRGSSELDDIWSVFSMMISFLGLAVRVLTISCVPAGTSGRNTDRQIADVLNTSGMYSLLRHPLYLGNYLIMLGVVTFFHSWWLLLLMSCLFALYYERIMLAEEAFLRQRFGERFERWAAVTPAIIPRLQNWRRPDLAFSWRTALRREYSGFFLIIAAFVALEIISHSVVEGRLRVGWPWSALLAFGALVYLVLRTLKKKTRMLDVPGR